jgi:pilus assembly protein TadC
LHRLHRGRPRAGFLAQDALAIVLGLPILLGSIWLARRGSLIGMLPWPGALIYLLSPTDVATIMGLLAFVAACFAPLLLFLRAATKRQYDMSSPRTVSR